MCEFNTIITRKATVFTTCKEILLQKCKKWFFRNDTGQLGSISVWMAIVSQFNFTWPIYGPKGITITQLRPSIFSTLTRYKILRTSCIHRWIKVNYHRPKLKKWWKLWQNMKHLKKLVITCTLKSSSSINRVLTPAIKSAWRSVSKSKKSKKFLKVTSNSIGFTNLAFQTLQTGSASRLPCLFLDLSTRLEKLSAKFHTSAFPKIKHLLLSRLDFFRLNSFSILWKSLSYFQCLFFFYTLLNKEKSTDQL